MKNIYLSKNTKRKVICFSKQSVKEFQAKINEATFDTYNNLENAVNIVKDCVGKDVPMYAVKAKSGMFITFGQKSWNLLTHGSKGAKGIKAKNISDAYKFLYGTNVPKNIMNSADLKVNPKETTLVYTDGSYSVKSGRMGVGFTIYYKNKEISSSSFISDKNGGSSVKAECISAMMVIDRAIKEKIKDITIVHDNECVHSYAVNAPTKKKSALWSKYHNYIKESSSRINIHFKKCKAHSGDANNNAIDKIVSYKNIEKILGIIE